MAKGKQGRPWPVFYGTDRLPNRTARRLARLAVKRGHEPQPTYRTGKYWTD